MIVKLTSEPIKCKKPNDPGLVSSSDVSKVNIKKKNRSALENLKFHDEVVRCFV